MKAIRSLYVHRAENGFHVTAYRLENGQKVDLTLNSKQSTGVLFEQVLKGWQGQGYKTNRTLENKPGEQIFEFYLPDENEQFLTAYAPSADLPPAPEKPTFDPAAMKAAADELVKL